MEVGPMVSPMVGFAFLPFLLLFFFLPVMMPRAEWKILVGFLMMFLLLGTLMVGVRVDREPVAVEAVPEAPPVAE